ncbi:MAG: TATA-box-binding protein [Candidatus Bathyarchaeota archaeon]|nr:TATA-box-binding protein [Candidatus Bathyarchaeota archaeon]
MTVRIENVVVAASFPQKLDLLTVANALRNTEYRPDVFPGLVFRLKRPKTAILIFGSGKMVCTGAKNVKEAIRAVRKAARELRKGGIRISNMPEIQVTNIVATANLGGYIDLDELASKGSGGRILYEPEQFPAVTYRWENPKVVFLVFSTGKIVCTGAKKEAEIPEAVERFQSMLEQEGFLVKEKLEGVI